MSHNAHVSDEKGQKTARKANFWPNFGIYRFSNMFSIFQFYHQNSNYFTPWVSTTKRSLQMQEQANFRQNQQEAKIDDLERTLDDFMNKSAELAAPSTYRVVFLKCRFWGKTRSFWVIFGSKNVFSSRFWAKKRYFRSFRV